MSRRPLLSSRSQAPSLFPAHLAYGLRPILPSSKRRGEVGRASARNEELFVSMRPQERLTQHLSWSVKRKTGKFTETGGSFPLHLHSLVSVGWRAAPHECVPV